MDSSPGSNKLTVTNNASAIPYPTDGNAAGINTTDGTLIIESGTVQANGGWCGAGIGGGNGNGDVSKAAGGTVIIRGTADVKAASTGGAGIGGGYLGSGGNIEISGNAQVTATGSANCAGIGGGNMGAGGNITISGNAGVTATGGDGGAGIGGGALDAGGNITISGGTVKAQGGIGGAGIGGGMVSAGGTINISGGTVEAIGGNGDFVQSVVNLGAGAGIGGGGGAYLSGHYTGDAGDSGDITISGNADVTATGGDGDDSQTVKGNAGAGIGTGGTQSGPGVQTYFEAGSFNDLKDTIESATTNITIAITDDITFTETIPIEEGIELTLISNTAGTNRTLLAGASVENMFTILGNTTPSDIDVTLNFTDIIIDGNNQSRAILYGNGTDSEGSLTIDGAVIQNCKATDNPATGSDDDAYGGGIYAFTADGDITITDTIIKDCAAIGVFQAYGGGLFCSLNSKLTIDGSELQRNKAEATNPDAMSQGGGLCVYGLEPAVEIDDTEIIDNCSHTPNSNSFGIGGGIYHSFMTDVAKNDKFTIANSTFSGNWAEQGFYLDPLPNLSGTGGMDWATWHTSNITSTTYTAPFANALSGYDIDFEGGGDYEVTFDYKDTTVSNRRFMVNTGTHLPPIINIIMPPSKSTMTPISWADENSVNTAFNFAGTAIAKDYTFVPSQKAIVTTYRLTVNNGTGGGDYAAGAQVTITANAAPSGQVFDRWTGGNGGTFSNTYSAITTFTMPGNAATVTATYKGDGSGNNNNNGGGGGGSYIPPSTTSGNIICNTISVSHNKTSGSLSSNVSAQTLRNIVDKAFKDADGSRTVKLDYSNVSNADKLTFTFDASKLKADEDITFIVETTFGAFIFTTEQMLEWFGGKEFGKYTITLEKSSLKVDIKKDGKSATWNKLTPMARIGVPYTLKSGENAANLVVADKGGRVLPTSVYEQGMVYADIFALGTYKVTAATPDSFSDTAGSWAKADIDYVTIRGLVSGDGDVFAPDAPITRADFITAFVKLAGVDVSGYRQSRYSDVSGADMPYIEWASEMGIVSGVGGGLFQPERSITREEMAVMMYRYADVLGYPLPVLVDAERFGDAASISDWANNAVAAMQRTDIVVGKPGGVFDPKGTFTRAESAAVLHRFVELVISSRDAEGWSNANNDLSKRVYYTQNGIELTGWQTIDGDKYYFDDKGIMAAGKWVQISGKWYYFNVDGTLATNTTVDGYEVGADGARK